MNVRPRAMRRFQGEIRKYYRRHRRDLPWRNTKNPYRIMVSEVMLQQTQVRRVIPAYKKFLRVFPDFRSLSRAPTAKILRAWLGLGYNRRALSLKRLSEIVVQKYGGMLPRDPALLEALPGIGRATAGAIMAYAFRKSVPFVETNVRRVYIHFFFRGKRNVRDEEILEVVGRTAPTRRIREWYWALMDYGSMLARAVENPNRRSARYRKQSKFEGSNREIRGRVLAALRRGPRLEKELREDLRVPAKRLRLVVVSLRREGFVRFSGKRVSFA